MKSSNGDNADRPRRGVRIVAMAAGGALVAAALAACSSTGGKPEDSGGGISAGRRTPNG